MSARPAVFLDRDGTLIEDRGFLADPAGVRVLPGVVDGLRALRAAGFALVVISNQSGIARGFFGHDAVRAVNGEIARRLDGDGVAIDGWYWCEHLDEGCACRKPGTALALQAAAELALDLAGARGAVVGDKGSDVALGHALGLPGILVPGPFPYRGPEPDLRVPSLREAADWILARG